MKLRNNIMKKKTGLVLLVLIIIIIFLSFEKDKYEEFISRNYSPIKTNVDDINDFSLMDEDVRNARIILAGEYHYIKYNYDLKFKLLKYLNKKFNVKYLLEEKSYTFAKLVNMYLETGDEKYLKAAKLISNKLVELYKNLYKYNRTLPENKRIKVIGFDIPITIYPMILYLHITFSNKKIPDVIKKYIKIIETNYNTIFIKKQMTKFIFKIPLYVPNEEYYNFISSFNKSVIKNKKIYKNLLKDEFKEFEYILKTELENLNLIKRVNYTILKNDRATTIRDKYTSKRLINFYNSHIGRDEKIFGQYGKRHLNFDNLGIKFLFRYLNEQNDSPFKGKVLAIYYLYKNCKVISSVGGTNIYFANYTDVYSTKFKYDLMEIFLKYAKTDLTLFRLTGANSPFNGKINDVIYVPVYLDVKYSLTDFIKYIIIIKNSKEYKE